MNFSRAPRLLALSAVLLGFAAKAVAVCPSGVPSTVAPGCPGSPSYPLSMALGQFYNWTGQGGYVITWDPGTTTSSGNVNLVVGGIPPGATVVNAFLWVVNGDSANAGTGACDLNVLRNQDWRGVPHVTCFRRGWIRRPSAC